MSAFSMCPRRAVRASQWHHQAINQYNSQCNSLLITRKQTSQIISKDLSPCPSTTRTIKPCSTTIRGEERAIKYRATVSRFKQTKLPGSSPFKKPTEWARYSCSHKNTSISKCSTCRSLPSRHSSLCISINSISRSRSSMAWSVTLQLQLFRAMVPLSQLPSSTKVPQAAMSQSKQLTQKTPSDKASCTQRSQEKQVQQTRLPGAIVSEFGRLEET